MRSSEMGFVLRGSPLPRIRAGLTRTRNLWQLIRFCLVGGSCYVINVATFAVAVEVAGVHYLAGAALAYACAVTSSFFGHRILTFRARHDKAPAQALRFVSVYLPTTFLGTGLLQLGVSAGVPEVAAQALSAGIAAPLSFTANKMWSFAPALMHAEAQEGRG
jgi:putative flippase GtrA